MGHGKWKRVSILDLPASSKLMGSLLHSYAFLVHGFGPAIDDFGFDFDADSSRTSSNVVIENNSIMDIQCYNREIPGTQYISFGVSPGTLHLALSHRHAYFSDFSRSDKWANPKRCPWLNLPVDRYS